MKLKIERIENLLEQCAVIAKMSKCTRRKFGAIITTPEGVKISDGYNGTVRGAWNCGKDVLCIKDVKQEPHYTSYVYCPAVHAERNAIFNAARNGIGVPLMGCYLFLNSSEVGKCQRPCQECRRAIVQAGIKFVVFKDENDNICVDSVSEYVKMENDWMMTIK